MRQEELQRVEAGFHDPVQGSQAVFSHALSALAMPSRVVELSSVAKLPTSGRGAAALLLLALLDNDCTLWLSPSLVGSDAQAWLRFHTGCQVVSDPARAGFLWLAAGDAWPRLAQMDAGSDEFPDHSATCIIEAASLRSDHDTHAFLLRGPGIAGCQPLVVEGLPEDFEAQWADNHAAFPRGVDVFLATHSQVVGLPRTTRLAHSETAEG
jgi:alpha-D-ribose 1-methylphosphonate 5-triphosphate synthase subunit PhnH